MTHPARCEAHHILDCRQCAVDDDTDIDPRVKELPYCETHGRLFHPVFWACEGCAAENPPRVTDGLCPRHGQVLSPAGGCGACQVDSMTQAHEDVTVFSRDIIGLPLPDSPTVLSGDRLRWTMSALAEEIQEFLEACTKRDVAEAADALTDLMYFAHGRLLEMGVPFKPVWDAVHEANMKKEKGEQAKRPGSLEHDAVKPEGWTPPNHSWLLRVTVNDLWWALMRKKENHQVRTPADDTTVGSYAHDAGEGKRAAVYLSPTAQADKHDEGKVPLSLIPREALELEARVFEHGREKYGAWNWIKGAAWSRYVDAALRHLNAFADGEEDDLESGLGHLGHLRCCAAMLISMQRLHPELDDRRKHD